MITPDLAAQVLDADLRNIVLKVSQGGILSTAERQLLQSAAVPDSQAKARRALALALNYAGGGRLTPAELAEVRAEHPGFAPEAVPADESRSVDAADTSPALLLTPQPSPANGDGKVSGAQLAAWSELYDTEHRQIRRWIARGRDRGAPCPLDDPEKMPTWIEAHLEKKRAALVEKINAVAAEARSRRLAQGAPPSPAAAPPAASTAGAAATAAPDAAGLVPSLDLSKVGGVEGESVAFFRTIFAAVRMQLEAAYAAGNDSDIRKLHVRLKDAGESLRKHEKDAEARAIRMGAYLDKAEVLNDVAQALRTLALLRELRVKRIRAELADVSPETLDRLVEVLNQVGSKEEEVLRHLDVLKSPEDVSVLMAA